MKKRSPLYNTRETIEARVDKQPGGCWLYRGYVHPLGYVPVLLNGQKWLGHRLFFTWYKGPIPEGMLVCHTCDIRHCVNPDHLFLGTYLDNNRDKSAKGRHHLQGRTHCPHGHEWTAENTYWDPRGKRNCRTCARIRLRIKSGWTREQAESIPACPLGHWPVKGHGKRNAHPTNEGC